MTILELTPFPLKMDKVCNFFLPKSHNFYKYPTAQPGFFLYKFRNVGQTCMLRDDMACHVFEKQDY